MEREQLMISYQSALKDDLLIQAAVRDLVSKAYVTGLKPFRIVVQHATNHAAFTVTLEPI